MESTPLPIKNTSSRQRFLLRRYHHLKRRLRKLLKNSQYSTKKVAHLLARLQRYARQLALPALSTAALLGLNISQASSQQMGEEFKVNSFSIGEQRHPEMLTDGLGNTVIVYESEDLDGDGFGIYMKRYNYSGEQIGAEIRVNSHNTNDQTNPAIAMNTSGDFVIVWQSLDQDGDSDGIYGQRYDNGGNTVGSEFLVNTWTTGQQRFPSAAMDSDGNFMIVWDSDQDGSGFGIYGQQYDNDGNTVGSEFQINTHTTNAQVIPDVAMDANGDFTVVWNSEEQDGDDYGVYGQRYDANGNTVGSEFQINTFTNRQQRYAAIAMDADGDFTVVWNSQQEQIGFTYSIYGQRYDANGNTVGSEFQVNTDRLLPRSQTRPAISMDTEGNFAVTWQSNGQDGSDLGIYAQRYDSNANTLGNEFQVNTFTNGAQSLPAIAMDTNSDIIVAWQSNGQDGSGNGIYAQAYLFGTGNEFLVNTETINSQFSSAIAMDSDGDFAIVWSSREQDGSSDGIYAQRYDSNGNTLGNEFQVNTFVLGAQRSPDIAMDADGNFVITWASDQQDGSNYGIYAQRYDNNGNTIGGEFQVNTETSNFQSFPDIAMDADGDFVITWTSLVQDGSNYGIYAQRYDRNGNTLGNEFQVNTFVLNAQQYSDIAMDADGDFVITWESYDQDGSTDGIYAQRYDNNGNTIGGEFQVNTETSNFQSFPDIAMDADGDFVITWTSLVQDGSSDGIYAQRYDNNGNTIGGEFQVNTEISSIQRLSAIAMDTDGNFVITWQSYDQDGSSYGIYAQRYDNNGSTIGGEFQVNTETSSSQRNPAIAMDTDGDFIITWHSSGQDGSENGIYAQRYLNKFPKSCPLDPLLLSATENSTAFYNTASTISSTQSIQNSADVHYQAGESITLQDGFEVQAGGTFLAEIEDCSMPSSLVSPSTSSFVHSETHTSEEVSTKHRHTLSIYPNPAQNRISFSVPAQEKVSGIWLYNHTGQIVQMGNVEQREMNLEKLHSGMYFLVVQTDEERYVEAIVKE